MEYSIFSIDGIIFDMDGVIFDSERVGMECWNIMAQRYSLGNIDKAAMECVGRNTADSMAIFTKYYGDKVNISQLFNESRDLYQQIVGKKGLPVKEGAEELLKWLKQNQVKVGLASSTSYKMVKNQLESYGLDKYFQVIVGGDMVEHSKPKPDIYIIACKKLGVDAKNTIAVEDSYNGVISAHKANMIVALVPDIVPPNKEMLNMANIHVTSLKEMINILSPAGGISR